MSPLFIFLLQNWWPFLFITWLFLISLVCHPLEGVTPYLCYLSDLICPLFFVNSPTRIIFPSGVTPGGCHPGRSAPPSLVTPLKQVSAQRQNVTVVLRSNIIFCDICCFKSASLRMSSLKSHHPPPFVRLLRYLAGKCEMTCRWVHMVNMKTGSRIPKWRLSLSETGSSYISAVNWYILSKFGMDINFPLMKQVSLIEIE